MFLVVVTKSIDKEQEHLIFNFKLLLGGILSNSLRESWEKLCSLDRVRESAKRPGRKCIWLPEKCNSWVCWSKHLRELFVLESTTNKDFIQTIIVPQWSCLVPGDIGRFLGFCLHRRQGIKRHGNWHLWSTFDAFAHKALWNLPEAAVSSHRWVFFSLQHPQLRLVLGLGSLTNRLFLLYVSLGFNSRLTFPCIFVGLLYMFVHTQ